MMTNERVRVGDRFPDIELLDDVGARWCSVDQRGRPLVLVLHRHLA